MTGLLLKLFVKNYKNTKNKNVRNAYCTLGGFTGIVCNLLLFLIKFIIGSVSGSLSIIADAFNNLSDMGSSVIVLLGFKIANKPADRKHPFGHGRIEYMSAFIVAILIIMVGAELLKTSIDKIFKPEPLEISLFTVVGLCISIAVKLWMNFFNRRLGRAVDSPPLLATAQDSLNDCVATFAVLVSILICKFTSLNIDAYVGTAVALFIIWSGIRSAMDTLSPLLGEPPDGQLINDIEKYILSYEDFLGIHDLIIHSYGPGRSFASVHVEVSDKINIVYCHEKIDECELLLKKKLGIDVVIHTDPISTDDTEVNKMHKKITDIVKNIDSSLSIHDFRMVDGQNRTNLIFDLLIPYQCTLKEDEILSRIKNSVRLIGEKYNCVINIDYDYTGR